MFKCTLILGKTYKNVCMHLNVVMARVVHWYIYTAACTCTNVFVCINSSGLETKDSRSTILGIKRPPSVDSFMVRRVIVVTKNIV